MKKKWIPFLCILLAAALLIPIPMRLKDGGTVKYQAILYSVSDVHRLSPSHRDGYEDGIIIEILGMRVFSSMEQTPETVHFHGQEIRRSDLSEETLAWLEWYNGLSEEEQLAVSYIPHDLYALWGYGSMVDIPAETP